MDQIKVNWEETEALAKRIALQYHELQNFKKNLIPPQLLRKYIVYARKYVHPKLTPDAKQILLDFYLKLRSEHQSVDSTPITTR